MSIVTRKLHSRISKSIAVAALLVGVSVPPAFAQVVFSDNFDAQTDWKSNQSTTGGITWGTTFEGVCTTNCPPDNWTSYRAAKSLWSPNTRDTYLINALGARGTSGKGLTYNVESTGTWGTWSGGAIDKYLGPTGHKELYVRFWLKESPEFCWGSEALNLNAMGKFLRVSALRRDPTANPRLFNPQLYPSPDTSPTMIADAYRRFQPNYGIPAQFSVTERFAPNYQSGPSTTYPAQIPSDITTGGKGYCGDDKWHSYEFYVKMNSALDRADGAYRVWLDGKLVVEKTTIPWVKSGTDSNGTVMSLATGWNWVMLADNVNSTAYPQSAMKEMARYIDDFVISTHYSGPPAAPVSVTATPGSGSVNLQWAGGSNGATFLVDGYNIYYGTDPAKLTSKMTVGNVNQAQITGLAATKYYFAVSGFNKHAVGSNENEGLRSAVASATVTTATSPAPAADTTAPVAGIVSPAAGSTLSGTVNINVSASDNVGVSKVELYLNSAVIGVIGTAPYTFTWNTANNANGAYTLTAKAYDAAGNIGTKAVSFNVSNSSTVADTTAPTVNTFAMPSTATSLTVPVTSFTAGDNNGVTGYMISASSTKPLASATTWNTTAPTSFTFAGTGLRTAYAWAKDAAGNVSAAKTAAVTISSTTTTSDSTAPTVTITSPAYGSTVSGTATVAASASDNLAVSKVEFYVNGVLKSTDTAAPYTFSWGTAAYANAGYSVTAKAYDAAGNVGSNSVTLYVANTPDTTLPAVSFTSPAYGSTVKGVATITANATDNVGVAKVAFYVNGVLKATDTAAPYSFSWDTRSYTNKAYTVSAQAYDAAGNVGIRKLTLYVVN